MYVHRASSSDYIGCQCTIVGADMTSDACVDASAWYTVMREQHSKELKQWAEHSEGRAAGVERPLPKLWCVQSTAILSDRYWLPRLLSHAGLRRSLATIGT